MCAAEQGIAIVAVVSITKARQGRHGLGKISLGFLKSLSREGMRILFAT